MCRKSQPLTLFILLSVGASTSGLGALFVQEKPKPDCIDYWHSIGLKGESQYLFNIKSRETYAAYRDRVKRQYCEKKWTIIVYMAANNDLRPFAYRDIFEMERIGSTPSVDVVVFLHTGRRLENGKETEQPGGPRYYPIAKNPDSFDTKKAIAEFVAKTRILKGSSAFKQEEGYLKSEGWKLVKSPPFPDKIFAEGDSGDPDTAGKFLRWAYEEFPSRRTMLIGWSHGQGFDARLPNEGDNTFAAELEKFKVNEEVRTEKPPGKQGGFAFDVTSGHHFYTDEMAKGLDELNQELRGGKKLDIAGSDSCYMGEFGLVRQFRGIVDYLFGSATLVQKKGFNYRALLELFAENPNKEPFEIAKEIPILFGNSVSRQGSGHQFSSYYDPYATMATWVVDESLFLERALNELGELLHGWLNPKEPGEREVRFAEVNERIRATLRFGGISNDLFNFCEVLGEWAKKKLGEAEIKKDGSELERWKRIEILLNTNIPDLIARAVPSHHIGEKYLHIGPGGGFPLSKAVAIWLPGSDEEFTEMFPKFLKSASYRDERDKNRPSSWARFVYDLGPPDPMFDPAVAKEIEKLFH